MRSTEFETRPREHRGAQARGLGSFCLEVIKSFDRVLFESFRLPSDKELEWRRKEAGREVVRIVGGRDSVLLAKGRYLTAEDIEEKRRRVLGTRAVTRRND